MQVTECTESMAEISLLLFVNYITVSFAFCLFSFSPKYYSTCAGAQRTVNKHCC